VPFIRFRKSLATDFPEGIQVKLESANKARERTLFIVNAASLPQFLKNWSILPLNYMGFATRRLSQRR
jgi:hypothetical protein